METKLLTYQDCADDLGVTVEAIKKYAYTGKLKTLRISHKVVRIEIQEWERFKKGETHGN